MIVKVYLKPFVAELSSATSSIHLPFAYKSKKILTLTTDSAHEILVMVNVSDALRTGYSG
ncbi:unnamed protein product [Fusarium graminearum]|uniref:Chromosome 2, complete genome n=1 Tax=Gibberella zeae (strain ATCC MYA-4620 / CBS 123657 / FGSC 9075 / NRRL 31084 / PH-1) TaxID=229533 RepID=A0A098DK02_GIBZE|nr:unnamed protein product [Fusarium graminearum]